MTQRPVGIRVVVTLMFATLVLSSGRAHAQAWVGGQGSLDLSVDYNFGHSDKILGTGLGMDFTNAGTDTHQFLFGVSYVPIPKLSLDVSLPLVLLKYTGDKAMYPHPGGGSYDDGKIHTTLTDFRGGVRYELLEDPVVITPMIAVSIPVASYETVGNTVAGRHLKAAHFGLNVGRFLTDALYVHAMYEFSLVESYDKTPETKKQGQNTSDIQATLGYKLLEDKLDVHVDGNFHLTHGGVNFGDLNFANAMDPLVLYHDPILKENQYLVGGGLTYQVAESVNINLSARLFVGGKNTQNASVFAAGVGWTAL